MTMLVDRMMVTILVTLLVIILVTLLVIILVTLHLARYKSIRRENAPPPPVGKGCHKTDKQSVSFVLVTNVVLGCGEANCTAMTQQ
jgi:hypothetical protein